MIKLAEKIYKGVNKRIFQTEKINYKNRGIIGLIDIGAIGKIPSPWLENSNYIKKLLRFEPRDQASITQNVISYDYAIGSKDEIRDFHIYNGNASQGSSFYQQNIDYVQKNYDILKKRGSSDLAKTWLERSRLLEIKKIQARTIDSILNELNSNTSFEFLKVDAQGAEYEIISGAEDYLKSQCLGLQLELFDVPLYKGIKLKHEVVSYLKEKGFALVHQSEAFGSFDSVTDCLFLKKDFSIKDTEKVNFIRRIYNI